jgi:hypothetical protein
MTLDAPCYRDLILFLGKHARVTHYESLKKQKKWIAKPNSQQQRDNVDIFEIAPQYLHSVLQVYSDAITTFGYTACVNSGIVTAVIAACMMSDKWQVAVALTRAAFANIESTKGKLSTTDVLMNKLLKVSLKKLIQYDFTSQVFGSDCLAYEAKDEQKKMYLHESGEMIFKQGLTRQSPSVLAHKINKRSDMIKIGNRMARQNHAALVYVLDLINIGQKTESNFVNAALLKLARTFVDDSLQTLWKNSPSIVKSKYNLVKQYMSDVIVVHNHIRDQLEEKIDQEDELTEMLETAVENLSEEEYGLIEDYYGDEEEQEAEEVKEWLLEDDNEDCVVTKDFWA